MRLLLPAALLLINVGELWTPPAAGQVLPTYYYSNYYYRLRTYRTYAVTYSRYRYYTMNRLKRYSRIYSPLRLGKFYYYHRFYPYVARMTGYTISSTYSSTTRKCANFETNIYSDFIGYFSCPLFFEPRNFTYCCGSTNYNYCCFDKSKSNPYSSGSGSGGSDDSIFFSTSAIIGISAGAILMGTGFVIFIVVCFCASSATRARINPWARTTVVTTNTSRGGVTVVQQQQQQQWATYQNPGFAGPPPSYPGHAPAYPAQPGAYPTQPGAYPAQPGAYPTQPAPGAFVAPPAPGVYAAQPLPPAYNAPAPASMPGVYPPTGDPAYPPSAAM